MSSNDETPLPDPAARDPGVPGPGERWLIRLYVAGMTPAARRALSNLREIARAHLDGDADIEVVDLLERPGIAGDEQIYAVPAAVRHRPEPVRKVIGDLSDTAKTLEGLDIRRAS